MPACDCCGRMLAHGQGLTHPTEDATVCADCFRDLNAAPASPLGTPQGDGEIAQVENAKGKAVLARFHKGRGMPKAEFANLMAVAGYASFDEALALWDGVVVEYEYATVRSDDAAKWEGRDGWERHEVVLRRVKLADRGGQQ